MLLVPKYTENTVIHKINKEGQQTTVVDPDRDLEQGTSVCVSNFKIKVFFFFF